ncbi:MAG: DUF5989 family protein [Clostridia bacterium]|nr:DUF5989 family protein [Clostridia bacterium]
MAKNAKKSPKAKTKKRSVFGSFSQEYEYRTQKRRMNRDNLALDVILVILICVFFMEAVCSVGFREILFIVLLALGGLLLAANVIFPLRVLAALDKLQKILNKVGKCILAVILVPVYVLLCLFSLVFAGKQRKRRAFASWKTSPEAKETYFTPDTSDRFSPGSSGTLRFLTRVVGAFSEKGQYFLFPILFILLLLGLIFFFISSSSVLGFVYTLF